MKSCRFYNSQIFIPERKRASISVMILMAGHNVGLHQNVMIFETSIFLLPDVNKEVKSLFDSSKLPPVGLFSRQLLENGIRC